MCGPTTFVNRTGKCAEQLETSGKQAEIEALLHERLESGQWRDALKDRCKALVVQRGADNLTVEELVHIVAPEGRTSVPGVVKEEVLTKIKEFLSTLQDA